MAIVALDPPTGITGGGTRPGVAQVSGNQGWTLRYTNMTSPSGPYPTMAFETVVPSARTSGATSSVENRLARAPQRSALGPSRGSANGVGSKTRSGDT